MTLPPAMWLRLVAVSIHGTVAVQKIPRTSVDMLDLSIAALRASRHNLKVDIKTFNKSLGDHAWRARAH